MKNNTTEALRNSEEITDNSTVCSTDCLDQYQIKSKFHLAGHMWRESTGRRQGWNLWLLIVPLFRINRHNDSFETGWHAVHHKYWTHGVRFNVFAVLL